MITRKVASRDFSRLLLTIQRTHGQRLFEGMDWGVSEPSATRHGRAWSNWRQQFPETRRFLEHRPRKRIARFLGTLPTVCGTFTILIGRGLHAVRTTGSLLLRPDRFANPNGVGYAHRRGASIDRPGSDWVTDQLRSDACEGVRGQLEPHGQGGAGLCASCRFVR